jgi:hypothetical protein
MTESAFRKRWSRNWRPRVATGVAATVGVVAGAGVIAATAKPSSNTPKASTPEEASDDGSQGTTATTVPAPTNPQFPWDDDDGGRFQPAPSGSGSSNFGGQPQASTGAS